MGLEEKGPTFGRGIVNLLGLFCRMNYSSSFLSPSLFTNFHVDSWCWGRELGLKEVDLKRGLRGEVCENLLQICLNLT
jgi:hypothetical protein